MMMATEASGGAAAGSATESATMDMSGASGTEEASSTEAAGTAQMPKIFGTGGCLFAASLAGPNEVPQPGPDSAYGSSIVAIDTTLGQVCWDIQVEGLTLPATAAHIHRGAPGVAGPVVVPLTAPDESGHSDGCVNDVDKGLLSEILSNPANFYVNVHTTDFPNGAARGQMVNATRMTGAEEVPPGDPDGFGVAAFSADTATGQVCYAINVGGISLPATAAHIHKGAPGVAGPIVIPLTAPDEEGAASGCVSNVDKTVLADILANPSAYYVNVHTSDFPQGALRGQLSVR